MLDITIKASTITRLFFYCHAMSKSQLPVLSDQNTALSIRLSNTLLATTKKILGGSGLLEMTHAELLTWWHDLTDEWKFLILQQGLDLKLWGDTYSADEFWFFNERYDYQAEFDWHNEMLIMPFLLQLKQKKQIAFSIESLKANNPLKALCYLTGIKLSIVHIDNPDVFVGLDNLTELSFLQRHQTINVQFIKKAHYLKKVTLDYGKIDNIDGLSYLINLTSLSLNHNLISDICPLKFLDKLEYLFINNNQLIDITTLAQLPMLSSLDLSYNQITNIETLSQLKNLKTLYLNNNHIYDIFALGELHQLEFLSLENNPISDEDMHWLYNALPNCLIFYNKNSLF